VLGLVKDRDGATGVGFQGVNGGMPVRLGRSLQSLEEETKRSQRVRCVKQAPNTHIRSAKERGLLAKKSEKEHEERTRDNYVVGKEESTEGRKTF